MLDTYAIGLLNIASSALSNVPARRFVCTGDPVAESGEDKNGQLTVHLDSLRAELSNKCAMVPSARFCTVLFRCVPTNYDDGTAPSIDTLGTSGLGLLTDLGNVWRAYSAARLNGTLVPGLDCPAITFQPAVPIPPRGGMAGFKVCIDIRLSMGPVTGS